MGGKPKLCDCGHRIDEHRRNGAWVWDTACMFHDEDGYCACGSIGIEGQPMPEGQWIQWADFPESQNERSTSS